MDILLLTGMFYFPNTILYPNIIIPRIHVKFKPPKSMKLIPIHPLLHRIHGISDLNSTFFHHINFNLIILTLNNSQDTIENF
jgi:hypothetical protein